MADRWAKSRALLERAARSLAGGVSSPFRAKAPVPLYFRSGCGSRLEDVDGNPYIDYTLAWGPLILGHCHPAVVEAIKRQAVFPHTLGAQHELEYAVAETIQKLVPGAERVLFTSSGTEAVQIALRLARAFTGRNLVMKFEGHYHGWVDSVLISHHPGAEEAGPHWLPVAVLESRGQPPDSAHNVVVEQWNDAAAVERCFGASSRKIAAVIMEPVLCNSGCLMPEPGYLEAVRDLCRAHGALLIFDEVITGFRMGLGGAQGYYGVTPDLATFGKALGGGLPLSAVAGRKEIVEQVVSGGVSFGGSFNGNPVVLGAAQATLAELKAGEGAALARANALGSELMRGIAELAAARSVPLSVTGFGAAFALHFTERRTLKNYRDTLADDRERLKRFLLRALEEGVYLLPDGRMYTSAVHTAEDIAETLAALGKAMAAME